MVKVPFVPNSEDDLHCFQASYLSIAKYYIPDFGMSWDDWCSVTGYEEGKGTWASAGLLWFKNQGFSVRHISLFDYERFIELGADYLVELVGEEVGNWQIKHTNLPLEIERAKQLLKNSLVEKSEPSLDDIRRYISDGWLVRVLVNSRTLNGKEGYVGHSVVVTDIDDLNVVFHDPGLPPIPNRQVSCELFEKSWAYPSKSNKEMDAIKI